MVTSQVALPYGVTHSSVAALRQSDQHCSVRARGPAARRAKDERRLNHLRGCYSKRSARNGSTRKARLAGNSAAMVTVMMKRPMAAR